MFEESFGRFRGGWAYVRLATTGDEGQPGFYWWRVMPRVPDSLAKSVLYLYPNRRAASRGEPAGGTALVAAVFDEGSRIGFTYLITCRHLVTDGVTWIRTNPIELGAQPIIRQTPVREWTQAQDDDLAVVRLDAQTRTPDMDMQPFLMDVTLEENECGPDNYGIGDDVYIVGRFVFADGKKVNVPTVRFGHVSAMPGQRIKYDCGRNRSLTQSGFLVETSVIEGYSGSPVWIYRGSDTFGEYTRLLGIVCAHFPDAGMALVVPSWRVLELLNRPRLVADRAKARKATRLRPGSVRRGGVVGGPSPSTPDASGPPPSPGSDESRSPVS